MRVISYENGRCALLVQLNELRPESGIPARELYDALQSRYQFQTTPDLNRPPEQIAREGFPFRNGTFVSPSGKVAIQSLIFYDMGIQADATTTENAEAIINDVYRWALQAFSLREPPRPPRLIAWSQLVVEFDKPLGKAFSGLAIVSDAMRSALNGLYDHAGAADLTRISFNFDHTRLPASPMHTELVIERRVNHPFSEERYFCASPFHTKQLIDVLQRIEDSIPSN